MNLQDMHTRWQTLASHFGRPQRPPQASWARQASATVQIAQPLINYDRAASREPRFVEKFYDDFGNGKNVSYAEALRAVMSERVYREEFPDFVTVSDSAFCRSTVLLCRFASVESAALCISDRSALQRPFLEIISSFVLMLAMPSGTLCYQCYFLCCIGCMKFDKYAGDGSSCSAATDLCLM